MIFTVSMLLTHLDTHDTLDTLDTHDNRKDCFALDTLHRLTMQVSNLLGHSLTYLVTYNDL
jgi:hypothetical protein